MSRPGGRPIEQILAKRRRPHACRQARAAARSCSRISVPYYPASHGCIRITVSAMNRLFSMLTIGMPVFVYRS